VFFGRLFAFSASFVRANVKICFPFLSDISAWFIAAGSLTFLGIELRGVAVGGAEKRFPPGRLNLFVDFSFSFLLMSCFFHPFFPLSLLFLFVFFEQSLLSGAL